MKIMERYILREFIKALLYCLTAFIFLYIIADLFNYIDEMLRNHLPIRTILIYYATFVPTIFVQVSPIAVLLATIYTLSILKKSNELTAMRASGVSLWKIITPILFAGGLLSLIVYVVNDRVVPELMPISSEIREKKIREIGKRKEKIVINNIAVFGADNRIIYARTFDTETNELKDVIIHQNDENQNLVMKLSAERAYWEGSRWIFENGTTYRLDKTGYIIGAPSSFRKKKVSIKEKPKDFMRKKWQPEFLNYRELKFYIDKFSKKASTTTRKLLVDLYYKTSFPFTNLVIIFIAAPLAFMVQRGGLLIGIGTSILIGLIFYGVLAVSIALGKGGILPPLLSVWLANILFSIAGFCLMKRCR